MEGVIGYTTLFAGNFAPKNWAFCSGQIINIASNTALFSILGTTYGGNGTTTFALPDLRGRAVVSAGQLTGGSYYQLGEIGGTETTTLNSTQMPAHVHPVNLTVTPKSGNTAGQNTANGACYAPDAGGNNIYSASPDQYMAPYQLNLQTSAAGGSQAFSNRNPVMALNYIICQYGVYPARN